MFNFYHNEFTDFLNNLYKAECKEFHMKYADGTYFMDWEDANEYDMDLCGTNECKVSCFRSIGYTIGHCVCDYNDIILKIVCYDRAVNDFVVDADKLNEMLNERFLGKKLILTDKEIIG